MVAIRLTINLTLASSLEERAHTTSKMPSCTLFALLEVMRDTVVDTMSAAFGKELRRTIASASSGVGCGTAESILYTCG